MSRGFPCPVDGCEVHLRDLIDSANHLREAHADLLDKLHAKKRRRPEGSP